jgi:hypothetical protein
MIEVHPNLFVGPQAEYESRVRYESGWVVVHACKEPYHREAVGYTTPTPPEGHPEYLIARRDHRLCLNLTDAPNPADIPAEVMDSAVAFIRENLRSGQRVFLHCQAAMSRSPGIAMLYLGTHTDRLPTESFETALSKYLEIYKSFSPRPGILGFLQDRWAAGVRAGAVSADQSDSTGR